MDGIIFPDPAVVQGYRELQKRFFHCVHQRQLRSQCFHPYQRFFFPLPALYCPPVHSASLTVTDTPPPRPHHLLCPVMKSSTMLSPCIHTTKNSAKVKAHIQLKEMTPIVSGPAAAYCVPSICCRTPLSPRNKCHSQHK